MPGTFTAQLSAAQPLTFTASLETAAPAPAAKVRRALAGKSRALRRALPKSAPHWVHTLATAADQFIVRRGKKSAGAVERHRGLSLVCRLGPRHHDRAAGTDHRARPLRHRGGTAAQLGRPSSIAACCRIAFPIGAPAPEYNSADAALWLFHALEDYLAAHRDPELVRELYPDADGASFTPTSRARGSAFRSTRATACCAPASPASRSPGWTRSTTGTCSPRASASRSRSMRCGSMPSMSRRASPGGCAAPPTSASAGPCSSAPPQASDASGMRIGTACSTSSTSDGGSAEDREPAPQPDLRRVAALQRAAGAADARRGRGLRARAARELRPAQPRSPRIRPTAGSTSGIRGSATPPTTRARCGAGCSGRLRGPITGCTAMRAWPSPSSPPSRSI